MRALVAPAAGADLLGQAAAALAAAATLFKERSPLYAQELIDAAQSLFAQARKYKKARPFLSCLLAPSLTCATPLLNACLHLSAPVCTCLHLSAPICTCLTSQTLPNTVPHISSGC